MRHVGGRRKVLEGVHRLQSSLDSRGDHRDRVAPATNTRGGVSIRASFTRTGLAYTFEQLALPYIRAKRLKRVLASFSPTFPGFYLYYPSRRQQPSKLKAFVEYALAHSRKR